MTGRMSRDMSPDCHVTSLSVSVSLWVSLEVPAPVEKPVSTRNLYRTLSNRLLYTVTRREKLSPRARILPAGLLNRE